MGVSLLAFFLVKASDAHHMSREPIFFVSGQEIPMCGYPPQPQIPYPMDPKAGPAPFHPGYAPVAGYPPTFPAAQYPLYPPGPPYYNPSGKTSLGSSSK